MAEVTLNKDGTPRKRGSGKTKGAGCFTKIQWSELKAFVGENTAIPVSRVWLRSLGVPVEEPVKENEVETKEKPPVDEPVTTQEIDSAVEPDLETESEEETTPIAAVTPPYRYAQDFDL